MQQENHAVALGALLRLCAMLRDEMVSSFTASPDRRAQTPRPRLSIWESAPSGLGPSAHLSRLAPSAGFVNRVNMRLATGRKGGWTGDPAGRDRGLHGLRGPRRQPWVKARLWGRGGASPLLQSHTVALRRRLRAAARCKDFAWSGVPETGKGRQGKRKKYQGIPASPPQRKPRSTLFLTAGLRLSRSDTRTSLGLMPQDPPRRTRCLPLPGPCGSCAGLLW